MILPDRYCRACVVAWDAGSSECCWLCGRPGYDPPLPETAEEMADAVITRLSSANGLFRR